MQDAGVKPAAVLISVAPIARKSGAEFTWARLDVEIPESAFTELELVKDGEDALKLSIRNALEAFEQVALAKENRGLSVPVGVNAEQILKRNLDQAGKMLVAFAQGAIGGSSSSISARKAEMRL